MLKVFLICAHRQLICFLKAKYLHPNSFILLLSQCYEHLRCSVVVFQQERESSALSRLWRKSIYIMLRTCGGQKCLPSPDPRRVSSPGWYLPGTWPCSRNRPICPVQTKNKNLPAPRGMAKTISIKGLSPFCLHP